MSGNIRNYIFNFEPEAKELLESLGEAGKKIALFETDVEPYAQDGKPQISFPSIVGDRQLMKKYQPKFQGSLNEKITAQQSMGSYCHVKTTPILRRKYHYISLQTKSQFAGSLGEENRPLLNLFTLYHETAHALTPGRLLGNSTIYKECVADAYAALRLLQRFGTGITPFISQFSWLRTHEALTAGTGHLSTTVLDKIILDSGKRDFSQLTPTETLRLAQRYAKDFTPKRRTLAKAENVLKHVRMDMPNIANVIKSSTVKFSLDDFTFSLLAKGASVFRPGELVYDGKSWKPQNAKYHEEMQSGVEARLATMHLRDMFNSKALTPAQGETPLAEALKVTLFPWQQQFIYQPKKFAHKA